eukprot:Phypoly_transcript_03371.p1 GENE.Phypoly_transcript_03371~~Phypoly_transcript_03371.p1  ORF type:complete len:769 (+),score=86.22 Phypoly_transcript_03371:100-2406(+)
MLPLRLHTLFIAILFLFCGFIFPVCHSLGFLREIQLNFPGTPKCIAISKESPTAYLVYTNNALVSFSSNTTVTNTTVNTWPTNWSNRVVACAHTAGILYVTRDDGTYSIIRTNGSFYYLSSTSHAENYTSSYVLISPYVTHDPRIHKFYVWPDKTGQIEKVDYNIFTSYPLSLDFIPSYGYAEDGNLYLFGNGKFASVSDPVLQTIVFSPGFISGGAGIHDQVAYFVTAECPLTITALDLQLYTVKTTNFPPTTNCTNSSTYASMEFSSNNPAKNGSSYMYLYLSDNQVNQTIYKFDLPSLTLADQMSSAQAETWIDFKSLLGPENVIVGYKNLSSQLFHLFYPTTCPAGFAPSLNSTTDTISCQICPLWTYPLRPFYFNSTCTPCPRNSYAPNYGICAPCEDGAYNGALCSPCILGEAYNSTRCSPCPSGFKGLIPGVCQRCEDGYSSSPGSRECYQCPLGFTSDALHPTCYLCPIGTFGVKPGNCTVCPPNSYTNTTGMLSCISTTCEEGFVANNNMCTPCPMGTYYDSSTSNKTCRSCPAGTYANETGMLECLDCESGTSSNVNPISCSVCPNRFYAPAKSPRCLPCPPGTKANGAKASACIPCEEGYVSESLSLTCHKCAAGAEPVAYSECVPCGPGNATENSIYCLPCGPNTYSPTSGQASCTPCPKWHYSPAYSTQCTACSNDLWGKSGCTPVAQICIGVLVPLAIIVAGLLGYKFWWKRRHTTDDGGISMSRFRRIEDFENFENSETNGEDSLQETTADGN